MFTPGLAICFVATILRPSHVYGVVMSVPASRDTSYDESNYRYRRIYLQSISVTHISRATVVGSARVMSYENIVEAQKQRDHLLPLSINCLAR